MKKSTTILSLVMTTIICLASNGKDGNSISLQSKDCGNGFKTVLNSLDWGTDTCFVYGHRKPDVDAVTSALSYAQLMRSLGYNCKAKVSEPINRETAYISRVLGFSLPELKDSVVPSTRIILTDHTDYTQSVKGARSAIILQKIDHHVEGDISDEGIPYVRREMVGSTNTIIYQMYKEQGVAIDDETARVMLAGIVSDTRNLSTSTTRGVDSTAWMALTTQLHITPDSVARLNRGMENAASDYTGMSALEIYHSDYKDFDINGSLIGFGSLICKESEMEEFTRRMLSIMSELLAQGHHKILVAKVDKLVENTGDDRLERPLINRGTYFLYCGEGTKDMAETMFGTSLREGVCFTLDQLSRKQIVPRMTKFLSRNCGCGCKCK